MCRTAKQTTPRPSESCRDQRPRMTRTPRSNRPRRKVTGPTPEQRRRRGSLKCCRPSRRRGRHRGRSSGAGDPPAKVEPPSARIGANARSNVHTTTLLNDRPSASATASSRRSSPSGNLTDRCAIRTPTTKHRRATDQHAGAWPQPKRRGTTARTPRPAPPPSTAHPRS
jgi:hypothetical protein